MPKKDTVSSEIEASISAQAYRPQEEAVEASGLLCSALQSALHSVWGQQLLPKCICAKARQPALPAHSKGHGVSGWAPVRGRKVRLVGGWPGWSFLTREPASQQDQPGCRVNHSPSHLHSLELAPQLTQSVRSKTRLVKNTRITSNSSLDNVEHRTTEAIG